MATLNGFLNPKKIETEKFILSDRFCDEEGNPLYWEVRCMSGNEIKEIQNKCVVTKQIGNKTHTDMDVEKFQDMVLAKSVMTPDPNASDLLDAYGVQDPCHIFGTMLTGEEYLSLYAKVSAVNGLNKNIENLVDEVKN